MARREIQQPAYGKPSITGARRRALHVRRMSGVQRTRRAFAVAKRVVLLLHKVTQCNPMRTCTRTSEHHRNHTVNAPIDSSANNMPHGTFAPHPCALAAAARSRPIKMQPRVRGLHVSHGEDSRFSSSGACRQTLQSTARRIRMCPVSPMLPVPARSRSCRGHRMYRVCQCPTR